ncbi:DUF1501 domain-containing protein [Agarilytica rhodophyticola]|uniref:DUF1501 domain-containing protein n=1 Tax=Agarilytica rhodophyticola TaxID=1737490 RepID=UPI000B344904|nr:DUF1501 domain-containing protein [Agarilytica rhodophyticola]
MSQFKSKRRDFLKSCASTTLGGAGAYASLSSLGMMNAFAQSNNDYKALVCLFLGGGNDGYNTIIPTDNSAYQQYSDARGPLAIPKGQVRAIQGRASDGNSYGVHPSMREVQELYNNGDLCFIGNVGSLIEPITRDNFISKNKQLPPFLFSHNNQTRFWQSLDIDVPRPRGWAGKMADAMMAHNQDSPISMNISVAGQNLFQSGNRTQPYIMSRKGVGRMNLFNRDRRRDEARIPVFEEMMSNSYQNIYANEYAKTARRAEELSVSVGAALDEVQTFTTQPAQPSALTDTFSTIAKVIAARSTLKMSRQIFFVSLGGWDTHNDQLSRHSELLSNLSKGLKYFYDLTKELNVANKVTTFTAADFGRTLSSNGSGSDHGWGNHQLVMGGAVRGRRIYGEMPELDFGGSLDAGRGRLIPTTSIDQYAATLASWYGLSASNVAEIFPNLGNFNNVDLGFMR